MLLIWQKSAPVKKMEQLIANLQNDLFEALHLQQTDDLSSFTVKNDAYVLLAYLRNTAKVEEKDNESRTYIVKDKQTKELVAYFTLGTGIITVKKDVWGKTPWKR